MVLRGLAHHQHSGRKTFESINWRTISSSKFKVVMMMLAKIGPSREPIATPSIYLKSSPFIEKERQLLYIYTEFRSRILQFPA